MNRSFGIMLLFLALPRFAYAADDWICSTQSSIRSGNVIQACGVGDASTESEARSMAADAASREFKFLCDQDSSSCLNHRVTLNPKRQTCSQTAGHFKCVRMIEYTIAKELDSTKVQANRKLASSDDHAGTDGSTVDPDAPKKIRKGMTKQALLEAFGTPDFYLKVDDRFLILNYINKDFCSDNRCTIGLDNDRVYKFDGFKIQNTTVLDTDGTPDGRSTKKIN